MKGMRNKQKEDDLIRKRNKAYKEADKYEAQLQNGTVTFIKAIGDRLRGHIHFHKH